MAAYLKVVKLKEYRSVIVALFSLSASYTRQNKGAWLQTRRLDVT